MKHSVRYRFTALFTIAVAVIIVITCLINKFGLERYYVARKADSILAAYERIDEQVMSGEGRGVRNSAMTEILSEYSEKNNISIAVVDSLTSAALITSERDGEVLMKRMQQHLFGGQEGEQGRLLKQSGNYTIVLYGEGEEFPRIEGFGYCSDNTTMVLMSSPVESLKDSVRVSTRFLTYVAAVMLVIGVVAVFLMTGHIVRVSELAAANEKLQADLVEKEKQNAVKQEFIANVSHELKTPLALIQGYAEGLSDGLCEDEESRKYYSDIIVDEADRMSRIVKQLLLLNSLESGVEEPEIAPFDLSAMTDGIAENERILAEQKQARIEKEIPAGLRAMGDEFKIESVVSNYVSNAVHHVGDGGTIRISLRRTPEGKLRCAVSNTGSHIPEEETEHIWDKFYKIDKSHSRSYGGSGIGLSIVRAVMEAHGQPYGVRNTEDGVEFWFELEEADSAAEGAKERP